MNRKPYITKSRVMWHRQRQTETKKEIAEKIEIIGVCVAGI